MTPQEVEQARDLIAALTSQREELAELEGIERRYARLVLENERLSARVDELLANATKDLDVVRAATTFCAGRGDFADLREAVTARAGK